MNQTKIKGGCQSGRKVVTHNSKSDLPLGKPSKKDLVMRDYCDLAEGIWEIIQTAGTIMMLSRGAKPRGMTSL